MKLFYYTLQTQLEEKLQKSAKALLKFFEDKIASDLFYLFSEYVP